MFADISDDLKLTVTIWLPKKDKIKLLDIFPIVVVQIVSINSTNDFSSTKTFGMVYLASDGSLLTSFVAIGNNVIGDIF